MNHPVATLALLLSGALNLALAEDEAKPKPVPVWSDEFNTDGLPDPAKWTYEVGMLRNNEAQYYTKERKENARVEGGNLVITARKEDFEKGHYTSASLTTAKKFEFTYGRVEVRAKIPTGRGMWPAIWMLGANHAEAGWPGCGEIDMMENVGFDPDLLHFNIHTKKYNHVLHTNKGAKFKADKPYDDFHVYALNWTRDRLEFFFDDHKTFTYENDHAGVESWPYDLPEYLILNVAVGGGWGGMKGIDDAIFPQQMLIDYVRVFKLGE